MNYLPLFHNLNKQKVVIIGGGKIALRKAKLLHKAGVLLTVVAPQINCHLSKLAHQIYLRQYQSNDLVNSVLVIVATNNHELNQQISRDAHLQKISVNVVDNPRLSNVIFPAIVERNPLIIAVSSIGFAPVLSRLVRSKIEQLLPANFGELAKFAQKWRNKVKDRLNSIQQRRILWQDVLSGSIAEQVLNGNVQQADEMLYSKLEQEHKKQGEVYLVGAGPGDPDLLTIKALRLMQQADVVLYDRLVNERIIDLCRRDAEFIYVGKSKNYHNISQNKINQLLIDYAQNGFKVLRLKGGDPFIFGRGGEEISELSRYKIPFQVVPGITAANGCAAYAGIPLTHRDYAHSVRFVTGHLKDGAHNLDWQNLVNTKQTLVFYMGLAGLPIICKKLIENGALADLPAVLIEQGTTFKQKVIIGNLANLADKVEQAKVHAPTLLIIGEVVKLRYSLAWFGKDNN